MRAVVLATKSFPFVSALPTLTDHSFRLFRLRGNRNRRNPLAVLFEQPTAQQVGISLCELANIATLVTD